MNPCLGLSFGLWFGLWSPSFGERSAIFSLKGYKHISCVNLLSHTQQQWQDVSWFPGPSMTDGT